LTASQALYQLSYTPEAGSGYQHPTPVRDGAALHGGDCGAGVRPDDNSGPALTTLTVGQTGDGAEFDVRRACSSPNGYDEGAQMSDSVEYRDGVFVATGPHGPADGGTGTALMVRPDEHLAPVDAAGPLATAELPPAGPVGPSPVPARPAGGARRLAVATVVAALIAAVAFGAAAFGGAFGSHSATPGSGRGALGVAGAASAGATSVAFTVSASRSTASSTATLVTGSGAVDLTTDVGRLSATVPALAGYVGSGNDSLDVVVAGNSAYLATPALSQVTGGDRWLKAPLPKDTSGNADTSTLAVLADPTRLLGLLSSVGGPVTTVGNVDLHGVPTTEYRTTVTLSELAARAGAPTGSALGTDIAKVLGNLGTTTVPVTAWVGTDGYVRQLSASLDLSRLTVGGLVGGLVDGTLGTSGGQATTSTTVTVGFSHYNQPVAVTVPPASQVTDLEGIVDSVKGAVSSFRHAVSSVAANF
jgi:hypothetical protein